MLTGTAAHEGGTTMLILGYAIVWFLLSISLALAGAAFMREGRGPRLSRADDPRTTNAPSYERPLAA